MIILFLFLYNYLYRIFLHYVKPSLSLYHWSNDQNTRITVYWRFHGWVFRELHNHDVFLGSIIIHRRLLRNDFKSKNSHETIDSAHVKSHRLTMWLKYPSLNSNNRLRYEIFFIAVTEFQTASNRELPCLIFNVVETRKSWYMLKVTWNP